MKVLLVVLFVVALAVVLSAVRISSLCSRLEEDREDGGNEV